MATQHRESSPQVVITVDSIRVRNEQASVDTSNAMSQHLMNRFISGAIDAQWVAVGGSNLRFQTTYSITPLRLESSDGHLSKKGRHQSMGRPYRRRKQLLGYIQEYG